MNGERIVFQCRACGCTLRMPATGAGRATTCPGCGAPVVVPDSPGAVSRPAPPGVAAPDAPASAALDASRIAVEVRARITWGDSPEAVRRWLAENGVDSGRGERVLEEALAERSVRMRAKGIADIVAGSIVAAGCLALAVALLSSKFVLLRGLRMASLALLAGAISGILWGLVRLATGIHRLALGARAKGADSAWDED